MKSGFKNPIASKSKEKEKPHDWDFKSTEYDQRSSVFVNAGTHHGIGHKQPVGHLGNARETVDTMPMTCRTIPVPHGKD